MIDPAAEVSIELIALTVIMILGITGIGILLVKQAKRRREQR